MTSATNGTMSFGGGSEQFCWRYFWRLKPEWLNHLGRRTLIPGGRGEEFRLLIASVTEEEEVPSVPRLAVMLWHFS